MRPILVYDSSCQRCEALAKAAEALAGDRLAVGSLHDPEIRRLLALTGAGDKWEPLLITGEAGDVTAHSGVAFRREMVRLLGVRNGLRLARLANATGVKRSGGQTRRGFLGRAAAMTVTAMFGPAAAARAGTGEGPPDLPNFVPADARVLERLRSDEAVLRAARVFGDPRWQEATVLEAARHQIVFLPLGDSARMRTLALDAVTTSVETLPVVIGLDDDEPAVWTVDGIELVRDGAVLTVDEAHLASPRTGLPIISPLVCMLNFFLEFYTKKCACPSCACSLCDTTIGISRVTACVLCFICLQLAYQYAADNCT